MNYFDSTFVSVSDLQKNTKACLIDINNVGRKVILSNNKPQAILLSLGEFLNLSKSSKNTILEVEPTQIEIEAIRKYESNRNTSLDSFIVADKDYFSNLR